MPRSCQSSISSMERLLLVQPLTAVALGGLPGEKGSDVSAREATRKMVAARRQLLGLHQVLTALPGVAPAKELAAAAAEAADGLRAHAPRNTIVRSVLKGLHR